MNEQARSREEGNRGSEFEEAIPKHWAKLVRSGCKKYGLDEKTAEDMAQETFAKAWEKLAMFEGDITKEERFGAWLFTIHRNACIDRFRRPANRRFVSFSTLPPSSEDDGRDSAYEPPNRPESALDRLETKEQVALLTKNLAQVKEPGQTILRLYYFEGWPDREIAEHLNQMPEAVKKARQRAIMRLRKSFDGCPPSGTMRQRRH